jgi:hypothetical protein
MSDVWFYLKLGLTHVLDPAAYDHILFLAALTVPFTFKSWKKVFWLVTVFTIAHCFSLALSAFEIVRVNVAYIEFLIPVTIFLTALFNIVLLNRTGEKGSFMGQLLATGFFGLIHGFGFSNYFNMLMAEETEKILPLLGFAGGIEMAQLSVILCILLMTYLFLSILKIPRKVVVLVASILVISITVPMLVNTFPT